METDPRLALVERFFHGTGRTYDFMVNVATLGIDRLWKRAILRRMPANPRRVLDLACGTGISTVAIACRFPASRVTGVELREEYLAFAREKMARQGIGNVEFALSRAETFHAEPGFDCITSSYLAKYADLEALARNCHELLAENGVLIAHDFTLPPQRTLVWIWRLYFVLLQRLVSPFFPAWREIFFGLPELIERTRWLPDLVSALHRHGFADIRTEYLTAYGSAIVTARKPG